MPLISHEPNTTVKSCLLCKGFSRHDYYEGECKKPFNSDLLGDGIYQSN
jgi:hypothetical protein